MPEARPILFSAPMIRALLDGRKTQTRRIIKPQPDRAWMEVEGVDWSGYYEGNTKCLWIKEPGGSKEIKCPYGTPGDLLWVRETFDAESRTSIYYRADGWGYDDDPNSGWKPSIFMPRWASRLTLEITDIRPERLQDISEADAMAEGIDIPLPEKYGCPYRSPKHSDGKHRIGDNAYTMYRDLWNDINGNDAWQLNPFVWALTFKVHKCNVDALLSQKAA